MDVIGHTQTERESQIVFVPRNDAILWFYADQRLLSKLKIRDSYLTPRMYESNYTLGQATNFSTLDVNSGY